MARARTNPINALSCRVAHPDASSGSPPGSIDRNITTTITITAITLITFPPPVLAFTLTFGFEHHYAPYNVTAGLRAP